MTLGQNDNTTSTPVGDALKKDAALLHESILNQVTTTIKEIANHPDNVNATSQSLSQTIKQYIDLVIASLNALKDLPQYASVRSYFITAIFVLQTLETILVMFG